MREDSPRIRAAVSCGAMPNRLERLDRRVLRAMRTRYHSPQSEAVVKALGTAGEWGAIWVALGLVAALADGARRERWLRTAAVAPASVGVNYPSSSPCAGDARGFSRLPPLAGAPSKLSFPSAHATSSLAAATAMGRVAPGARPPLLRARGRDLPHAALPRHALPVRRARRRCAGARDREALARAFA